jgi:predicted nucleic acid-binding protein
VVSYLADTSALARQAAKPEVRAVLKPLLGEGKVFTCGVVDLEVLHSATSPDNYRAGSLVLQSMPRAPLDERCVERALEVKADLAGRSQHRAVALPDLLIAACAERAELTVLHYDADYERIAAVTGQPVQWVVPRGAVS